MNFQFDFFPAKGQGIPRDDVLLHVDNTDSTLLHLAVESGVAKVHNRLFTTGSAFMGSTKKIMLLNSYICLPMNSRKLS